MDAGCQGLDSHVHERSRARAATGAGCDCAEQDAGANIVEGEERESDTSCKNIKIKN